MGKTKLFARHLTLAFILATAGCESIFKNNPTINSDTPFVTLEGPNSQVQGTDTPSKPVSQNQAVQQGLVH